MAEKEVRKRKGFPTFPFLLLVIGIIWLVEPYITESTSIVIVPILLIVLAIGWIVNLNKRR